MRSIKSGANAYLNKGSSPDVLFEAIFKVVSGGIYITPAIAELLAKNVRQDLEQTPHEALSNREFQVLKLLARGHTVTEIALQLSLSVNTISTYRSRICEKIGVRSLVELLTYATRHQLISSIVWAVSSAANCILRRLACAGWIPAKLPDSKYFRRPLWRNDVIMLT